MYYSLKIIYVSPTMNTDCWRYFRIIFALLQNINRKHTHASFEISYVTVIWKPCHHMASDDTWDYFLLKIKYQTLNRSWLQELILYLWLFWLVWHSVNEKKWYFWAQSAQMDRCTGSVHLHCQCDSFLQDSDSWRRGRLVLGKAVGGGSSLAAGLVQPLPELLPGHGVCYKQGSAGWVI